MRPAVLTKVKGCIAAQGMAPQRSKSHQVQVARRAHERGVKRRGRLLETEAPTLNKWLLTLLTTPLPLLLISRSFIAVDAASSNAPAEGREQKLPPGSR